MLSSRKKIIFFLPLLTLSINSSANNLNPAIRPASAKALPVTKKLNPTDGNARLAATAPVDNAPNAEKPINLTNNKKLQAASFNWFLDFTPLVTFFNYKEYDDSKFFIDMQGLLFGGKLNGYFQWANGFYYQPIDITTFGGTLYYTSQGSGKIAHDPFFVIEAKNQIGYRFSSRPNANFILATGIGYRFSANPAAGITTDAGYTGYDRYNHLLMLPLTFHYQYGTADDVFRFSMTSQINWILMGWQDTRLPIDTVDGKLYYVDGNNQNSVNNFLTARGQGRTGVTVVSLINKQGFGYGVKQYFRFEIAKIILEPYVSYHYLPESRFKAIAYDNLPSGQRGVVEPENTTFEAGFGFGYSF